MSFKHDQNVFGISSLNDGLSVSTRKQAHTELEMYLVKHNF